MIGASLYIIVCTARNRLRMRLRRLREPRYLIGAIVGAAYLYFSIFGRFRSGRVSAARRRSRGNAPPVALATLAATAPALAGYGLMAMAALAWILPFESVMLDFSRAEVQFLFTAPVSRRWLVVHRMLRSQLGILFGSMIIGVFAAPTAAGSMRLRVAIATWVLMSTVRVYFTGVSLSRSRLTSEASRARRTAWLPIAIIVAALVVVGTAATRALGASPIADAQELFVRLVAVATTGVSGIVMAPFVALGRPFFAEWPVSYLMSLVGSAAVLVICVIWILQSDAVFQDAAVEAADRKAQLSSRSNVYNVRGGVWRLAPIGRPEMAFAWKAATQTVRIMDRRAAARTAIFLIALTTAASSMARASGLATTLGIFALLAAVFCVLMAPQAIRMDMRQDLEHLELLKTLPVPAAAVVRGEMIWPGVLMTGMAWFAAAMAMVLSASALPRMALATRLSLATAFVVLAPALVFAQLVVHNGVALAFPAWVQLGNQRARGVDAMGQRIIMLAGTWLLLAVMTLPGALAGGVVWFVLRVFIGTAAYIPAAFVCAVIVAIEILAATEALGPLYERVDATAVERAE